MARPWQYRSPDSRLADIQYARDLEEERSAGLDELDNQRERDTQRQFQVELRRAAALDQRDDLAKQMEAEQARSAELDRQEAEQPRRLGMAGRAQAGLPLGPAVPGEAPRRVYPGGEVGPSLTPEFAEWEAFVGGAKFTPTGGTRGFQEFYGRYRANLETRLATMERRNQQRAVEGLPPLTEEEEDLAARRHAWDELQAKGAVQRGWGTAFEALDYPRQLVKEKVIEPVVPEFVQKIPGEVLETALPAEVREAAGVIRAVGGPSIPDVTITSGQVEEIASWILDPWNLLPVVGWGPDLVRAANAARKGVPTALRGLLKNPQVRTFLDDAIRAGERGGPKVPGVGPEDVARVTPEGAPTKGPKLPDWQPPIERLAERWPEVQKTWKVTKGARRAEMTKRTRRYMDKFEDLMGQGLTPEEAKEGAFVEFGGEMPDVQLVEAFTTTVEESKALTYRALVDFPRETGHPLTGVRALESIVGMASKRTPRPGELKAIREVFGDGLADAIEKAIRDKDFMNTAMELWMFPKVVRSSFDISFPARQGVMTAFRHPLLWSKSIKDSVRAFADPDWMIREIDKLRKDKTMYGVKMPDGSVQDMEFGSILDEVMGVLPEDVEPFYHAGMAEKWFDKLFLIESGPIKRSRVAFTGAGNGLRAGMARHWLNHWTRAGVDITPERLEKLGALLNALTGRATVPRGVLFDLLQATWWSPQYRLAGPQVVGTILKHGVGALPRPGGKLVQSADAQIARVAAESFFSFVGGGIGILSLLKASGLADVELDPRSSDFGKIKLGPTRINFFGTSQLLVRTIAEMVTQTRIDPELGPQVIHPGGVAIRYWKSGASPEFQIALDLATGQTYLGRQMFPSEERGVSWADIAEREVAPWTSEGGQRIMPLALLDIKDAIEQDALRGGLIGSLGMVGLGVQSYEPRAAQELQNIPEYKHMEVPQIQELKGFWDEVKDFRRRAEEEEGMVVPPELAIRVLGEVMEHSSAFIELAVDLRAGTTTRKDARNPDYLRFIVENEDEIREDAPWLITQEIRLLIHEMREGKPAAAAP